MTTTQTQQKLEEGRNYSIGDPAHNIPVRYLGVQIDSLFGNAHRFIRGIHEKGELSAIARIGIDVDSLHVDEAGIVTDKSGRYGTIFVHKHSTVDQEEFDRLAKLLDGGSS
jgi:hypothetical protein